MTRLLIVNVNAYWMKNFSGRIDDICRKAKDAKADILAVNELWITNEDGEAKYRHGKRMSELMGWGGRRVKDDKNPKKDESFIQHGNFGPVATALIWNPDKVHAINGGRITTYSGWPRNNGATWADLIADGKRARYEVTHLEFYPIGPNTIPKYDTIRRRQTDGGLDQLQRKGRTMFILGDMNCDLNDARDGFGLAAHEHGLKDFDEVSKNRKNGSRTTARTGPQKGMRILRGACTTDVKCTAQDTIDMSGFTDHNALLQEYTIPF